MTSFDGREFLARNLEPVKHFVRETPHLVGGPVGLGVENHWELL